ncbi:FAD-dependent thymidylate synthase [Ancylobacter amanitiformis]|uniref:Flavin-dependent thymidylate synthase n=1 Tax=Ancylobacter amanitiformis TaxID=217069 RepID=A0ABU0LV42_9HYPH|nr:FAD-dependent thymidylate synthase [Ancylobacter amanitiformis]MDQ0512573.1 thymidylate synthase (FAD) [Ancylobacter amanitiformis]
MTITSKQQEDIDRARATSSQTLRPTVPAMEELLFQSTAVLDHGFLRVVDYMGDDSSVVQAARVSYGRGTRKTSEDAALIAYLMRHWHSTPFEMCEIKLHVKLPIFVARQWVRHRTASINEYSARYSVLDGEFYIPSPEHLAAQSSTNRQGRDAVLSGDEAQEVLHLLRNDAVRSYEHYGWMLNDGTADQQIDGGRLGLTRELARIGLSLNTYTQWYWKTDLHNLLRFLRLRADSHAQYEIRAYAELMLDIVRQWVPLTHAAFLEHQMHAATFSASALAAIRRMIAGESVNAQNSGLSRREWDDLRSALELSGS